MAEGIRVQKTLLAFCVGVGLLLIGLPVAYLTWPAPKPVMLNNVQIGPFELVDAQGNAVNEKTFEGRWKLVFFGFTQCPDVCPTTLATFSTVLAGLGARADTLQPLFITLDPKRDTPDVMGDYTAFFDPRIVGLTGSQQQIQRISDAYGVYVKKVRTGASYTLDHTTTVYLLSPDDVLVKAFSHRDADGLTQDIMQRLGVD